MERVKRYFDQIKADEELKEKTMSYIREKIAAEKEKNNKLTSSPYSAKERKHSLKRLSFAALPIAACLIIIAGGYAYYETPVNYVSLDINPSIEMGLNCFGRVVKSEAINTDGNSLLNGAKMINMTADDAIKKLALKAKKEGYIQDDGSTVIAVTVLSKQNDTAERIRAQADKTLRSMISKGMLNAIVYTDSADLQLRAEAQKNGLSPGKYKLIILLQSLDSDTKIDQYQNARITDILVKANELLQQNNDLGSGRYKWNFEMIQEAAEQVKEIKGDITREQSTEQEQNRNMNPSSIEQEQEQNQSKYSKKPSVIDPNDGSVNKEQTTGLNQDQSQNQEGGSLNPEQGQNQENGYSEQTDNQNQSQMTNQSDEGQGQSNPNPQNPNSNSENSQEKANDSGESSGGSGGNHQNKQNPN